MLARLLVAFKSPPTARERAKCPIHIIAVGLITIPLLGEEN